MNDVWQAQDSFWNSFDLPAVDANSDYVVEELGFPHITYEAVSGILGQTATINISLWYFSTSWAEISRKSEEILESMGLGVVLPLETGYLWIKVPESTMVANRMIGGDDSKYKRINMTFEVECLK